jgi:hypothetical protein
MFFFHIQDRFGHIPDEEGAEFATLEQAKEEAKATARDIARQWLNEGGPADEQCIEIRNSGGEVITTLSVREILAHPVSPNFQANCQSDNIVTLATKAH